MKKKCLVLLWSILMLSISASCGNESSKKEGSQLIEEEVASTQESDDTPLTNNSKETTNNSVNQTSKDSSKLQVPDEEIILSEVAQRQVSSFAAFYLYSGYTDISELNGKYVSTIYNYINYVNNLQMESDTLPFSWASGTVTEDEIKIFFKNGLGIEIPSDYNFDDGWVSLSNNQLQAEGDGEAILLAGKSAVVDSQNGNEVVISGSYSVDDFSEIKEYVFTANTVLSENNYLFGGLQFTKIGASIEEEKDNITTKTDMTTKVDSTTITMDSMTEQILGTDIAYADDENADINANDFGTKIVLLFPSSMYQTASVPGSIVAEQKNMKLAINSLFARNENSIGKIVAIDNDVETTNYIMKEKQILNNEGKSVGYAYTIVNKTNGVTARVEIIIQNIDESNFNEFSEDYLTKFKDTLVKSIE